MKIQFLINEKDAGQKLGIFLRKKAFSASLIRSIKHRSKGFCVNGEFAKTDQILKTDDLVEIFLEDEKNETILPQNIPLEIIYESKHIMAINKPAGIAVHPTLTYKDGTIANGFLYLCNKRNENMAFRPIGRLDKNTSGLMLIAKNAYSAAFMQGNVEKKYIAIAQGCVGQKDEEGIINAPLGRKESSIIEQQVDINKGKESITKYKVIDACRGMSYIQVMPQTGRTHQIRVHFAYIGHPLLGDVLYGGSDNILKRHALHCEEIAFCEPEKPETTRISCKLASDMVNAWNNGELL